MAVGFVSATSVQVGGGSGVTGSRPAGASAGHAFLGFLRTEGAATGPDIPAPSGWTKVAVGATSPPGTAYVRCAFYIHIFNGSDPTYTWADTGSIYTNLVVSAWSGVDNATPIVTGEHSEQGYDTAAPAIASITTAAGGMLVGGLGTWGAAASAPFTSPPAGTSSAANADLTNVVYVTVGPGATGSKVWTIPQDYSSVAGVVLQAAGGGGGGGALLFARRGAVYEPVREEAFARRRHYLVSAGAPAAALPPFARRQLRDVALREDVRLFRRALPSAAPATEGVLVFYVQAQERPRYTDEPQRRLRLVLGSQTVAPVGVGQETDTAIAAQLAKQLGTGLAQETDAALTPAALVRTLATSTATETDSGLAGTLTKFLAAGLSGETDAALGPSITAGFSASASLEDDTAVARTLSKQIQTGAATETDSAQAPGLTSGRFVGAGDESDTALARSLSKILGTGLAACTESAQPPTIARQLNALPSVETAVALSLALTRALSAGACAEADVAVAVGFPLRPGTASEADAALAPAFGSGLPEVPPRTGFWTKAPAPRTGAWTKH